MGFGGCCSKRRPSAAMSYSNPPAYVPMTNEIPSDAPNIKNPLEYLPKRVRNSLFLSDTSVPEILNLILAQDRKKGHGYDLVTNRIIQKSSSTIAPFLETLFLIFA